MKDHGAKLLDGLVDSVPKDLRALADSLRSQMDGLRAMLDDFSSTTPFPSVTAFLLFLLTRCQGGGMSREQQQLLLLVLHHPEFRIGDAPKHIRELDLMQASLPLTKPGSLWFCLICNRSLSQNRSKRRKQSRSGQKLRTAS